MALKYQSGFGNHFSTEAVPGALPHGQNSPQVSPKGLYAEQISGSAFTAPRLLNKRSWVYRIQPSVTHGEFRKKLEHKAFGRGAFVEDVAPIQFRWNAPSLPKTKTDFLSSLRCLAGNGDAETQIGMNFYVYATNANDDKTFLYSSDGEWVFLPVAGGLLLKTEFGVLEVAPREIAVIPRGTRFQVTMIDKTATGYVCENMGAPFRLPDLGPIGANGLANPRDFLSPVAAFEERRGKFRLVSKFLGQLWEASLDHSPLDIVAWHGNYCPYKYDLSLFNTIGTVSFDHPDPSIFTVLTSPSDTGGTPHMDFVIFPPRWMVAEHTFRPPYFHRNAMSELMGLIDGAYDAKAEGFFPGGTSLHNCMSGHGPDAGTFEKASKAKLDPHYVDNTLAFMFESRFVVRPTQWALATKDLVQEDYVKCWSGLNPKFKAKGK
ncbi:MAG: homogentisate 1,2-dioxygenase [Bdellovibrionota bacterium]